MGSKNSKIGKIIRSCFSKVLVRRKKLHIIKNSAPLTIKGDNVFHRNPCQKQEDSEHYL